MHVSLAGRYRILVHRGDGSLKADTGWFDNLITNQGLDWFGVSPSTQPLSTIFTRWCSVGTGTATPTFADTVLSSQLYPSADINGSTSSYVAGPPAYWSSICTFQWSQGAIVANISEVGMGCIRDPNYPGSSVNDLYSRALIVDGGGSPTTLAVTATDTLSVSYEARLYIDTTDTSYSIVIGGVTYSGIYRYAKIGTPSLLLSRLDSSPSYPSVDYCDGSIGTIAQEPSGTRFGGNPSQITWTFGPYTVGTYTQQMTGLVNANAYFSLDITAIELTTHLGRWQFSVSPFLPRASYQSISTTWALSWGRYP